MSTYLLLFFWTAAALRGWEGHNWDQWREVSTWQKAELHSAQAGRSHLVPVLDGERGGAGRIVLATDWEKRRAEVASIIGQILGEPRDLKPSPVEVLELGSAELDGYTRRQLRIRSEADDWIPAFLLVPNPVPSNAAPAMLCLHQTVAQGKEEPCGLRGNPELAFAVELVKRGYVCLAPDVIGFGERIPAGQKPYYNSLAFYRRHPGWSFMGKMVWDVGRMIDYLETLPYVDAKRLGSIGHSHGAYGTLFAAAFEPRITAAVASCGFTTFRTDPNPERWSHATALIPQLGAYLPDVASIPFDWQHVLALIAPRPLFVWYTTRDSIFPNTANLDGLLSDVREVYRLQGKPDQLTWKSVEGPHEFPKAARQLAYQWLDTIFTQRTPPPDLRTSDGSGLPAPAAQPPAPAFTGVKTGSALFPEELVRLARINAPAHAWAAGIRDALVKAAQPWMDLPDDALWNLMFGNSIRRAWQVWSNGHCPSCKQPVPMYEWIADALRRPWKMQCPRCQEFFPKNDFLAFYRSGLSPQGVFDPVRADRSLLFNTDHPDPSDPLHRFGVDDGEGYTEGDRRWRFIGAYLIFGQWKQAIVGGIRSLAAAYLATGDPAYAHKAGLLLDRVADLYPTFDFGREGVMYEGPPRAGYVSTWHDACVEVLDLALAYDAIFEAIARDHQLVAFLGAKAAAAQLGRPKASFADVQHSIEERIFRDTLKHRPKIESNYPSTDVTIVTLETVLGWPDNRAEVLRLLDAIITKATAVDGVTGEKGIAGYTTIAPRAMAELLGRYARVDLSFIPSLLRRHPRLHAMYRFHIDTWCLGQYYPRTGDTGSFAERTSHYAGLAFSRNPGIDPSSYAFLWQLYEATRDPDLVRVLYRENGSTVEGLPYDLFSRDPEAFQAGVARVIAQAGTELKLGSVNKTEWGLAILRSGEGTNARAAWLDYDSGERHGHADAMTIGLFAKGLDLLPDFGYPPVQYGGWAAPRAVWYTQTAAHCTVAVDGKNTRPGQGRTTLWFEGSQVQAVRASAPQLIGGRQFERTLALVDISPEDSYLVDLFRVAGGREHTRFIHGHFGSLRTTGVDFQPVVKPAFGEVMRNFRQGPPRSEEGWMADWEVDDRLGYLAPGREVHLRLVDPAREGEVAIAETWVSVGSFGGTAEAWIPSVLAMRTTSPGPLASTFVSVLEPYETKPNLAAVRRLPLQDEEGRPAPDGCVGLEVQLVRGGRDVWLAANPGEAMAGAAAGPRVLVEGQSGLRFEGALCMVRFDGARPIRVMLGHGRSLRLGRLGIQVRSPGGSFEIDLTRPDAPVVAGPGAELEWIELDGVRIWP